MARPLKTIAFVVFDDLFRVGYGVTHIYNKCKSLIELGINLYLICPGKPGFEIEGLSVISFERFDGLLGGMRTRKFAAQNLQAVLEAGGVDAVLTRGLWGSLAEVAARAGVALFCDVNGSLIDEMRGNRQPGLKIWLAKRREARAAALCAGAVFSGHAWQKRVSERYPILKSKSTVVGLGCDATQFSVADDATRQEVRADFGIPPEATVVGYLGSLRHDHEFEGVIEVLRKREDLHFLVVGDGPGLEELNGQISQAGLAGRTTFTGRIEHRDVPRSLQAFDIGLMPQKPGLGVAAIKLYEYLSAGVLVVTPDNPDLAWLEPSLGFRTQDNSARELERALEALGPEPSSMEKRQARHDYVSQHASWKQRTQELLEFMRPRLV